ncbi:hypothetical protein HU200_054552 [Digitaria exilis]|uniref:Beta-glucosidase n=1 Tax=Digitaria exilis TaxID=1010633 RepID=A0A835E483_9POAL|nr:hypothetical protein HU200_054552 [Digitaria exilis]
MALDVMYFEPYDEETFLDKQARERAIDFNLGWFMEPVFRGDYPFSMRSLVGNRLPYFRDDEKEKLVHSYDMMGLNYYTSMFAEHIDLSSGFSPTVNTDDSYANLQTGLYWLKLYPKGLKELLMIMKDKYGNPPIYITENGTTVPYTLKSALTSHFVVRLYIFLHTHIHIMISDFCLCSLGAEVQGHFAWSLLDNFEWTNGYTPRFGLIYVDRDDGFKRYMKKSARWFSEFNRGPKKGL